MVTYLFRYFSSATPTKGVGQDRELTQGGVGARMKVADIETTKKDSAEASILEVYAKYPPYYAVYRTPQRVLIQFADGPELEQVQRRNLAVLNPLRGEINGLIDGWHDSKNKRLLSNSRRFQRRVADALVVGLEDDIPDALTLLTAVKTDLLDERNSAGRVQYLSVACITAALLTLIAALAQAPLYFWLTPAVRAAAGQTPGQSLALSVAAGSLGAFFSVALAIRGRTVLTDLRRRDNTVDALLRIVVGAMSGPILICLFLTHTLNFDLGGAKLAGTATPDQDAWIRVLMIAFVAGFLERLVPDLLAKTTVGGVTPPSPSEVMPANKAMAAAALKAPVAADGGAAAGAVDGDAVDGCLTGATVATVDVTADAELPPAFGG